MSFPPPHPLPPPPPGAAASTPALAGPSVPTARRRPGWLAKGLLALFAILLVAGLLALIGSVKSFSDATGSLSRASGPGVSTVTLDAGEQVVYAEYPGANCNGVRRRRGRRTGCERVAMPLFQLSVRGPDERLVDVGTYGSSLSYSSGGHTGRAFGTIDVPESGDYTVTLTGSPITVAIGDSIAGSIVRLVLSILVLLTGLVGLVATAITVLVRRRPRPMRV